MHIVLFQQKIARFPLAKMNVISIGPRDGQRDRFATSSENPDTRFSIEIPDARIPVEK